MIESLVLCHPHATRSCGSRCFEGLAERERRCWRHVSVVRAEFERGCGPARVTLQVCGRMELAMEPVPVRRRFALVNDVVGSPTRAIPGRFQSGVATTAATRVTRWSIPARATLMSPPMDMPPTTLLSAATSSRSVAQPSTCTASRVLCPRIGHMFLRKWKKTCSITARLSP
jgi:hypothetical protein